MAPENETATLETQGTADTKTQDDVVVDNENTTEKAAEGNTETKPDQQAKTDGKPFVADGYDTREAWLDDLIIKIEQNPKYELDDNEMDVYEEYCDGKIEPTEAKAGKKVEDKTDTDDDTEDEEDETQDTKKEKKASKAQETELSSIDMELMKEVGAKDKTEILDKVKGLRKAISGKLEKAPEYANLKTQMGQMAHKMNQEVKFWTDFKAGSPEADKWLQEKFGVQITRDGKQSQTQQKEKNKTVKAMVDNKIIDDTAAEHLNGIFGHLNQQIEDLKKQVGEQTDRYTQQQDKLDKRDAKTTLIDEMVRVAPNIKGLKAEKNLREKIISWYDKGQANPKMEYFRDLFLIGNKHNVDLMTALQIDKGRKADLLLEEAKDDGRKEVYNKKPTKSLSDLQGKSGEFQKYTDQDLKEMALGKKTMPEEWFDKDDNPDRSKMPKSAHKLFWED